MRAVNALAVGGNTSKRGRGDRPSIAYRPVGTYQQTLTCALIREMSTPAVIEKPAAIELLSAVPDQDRSSTKGQRLSAPQWANAAIDHGLAQAATSNGPLSKRPPITSTKSSST
jgi:hypothetical protein